MKYFTSVLNQSSPPVSNTTKHLQKYADHYRVMRSWHVQPLNSQYGAASKKKCSFYQLDVFLLTEK